MISNNWSIFNFHSITSTMDLAKEYIQKKDIDQFVIVAENQTNGRGRNNKKWISSSYKNLYATLALKNQNIQQVPLLSYVSSLSMFYTIKDFIKMKNSIKLKCPNDLMLDGKKVCGILLEIESDTLLLGIGVNLSDNPSLDTNYQATNIKSSTNIQINKFIFLEAFLKNFNKWRKILKYYGFQAIKEDWLKNMDPNYHNIRIKVSENKSYEGSIKDIDSNGCLILQLKNLNTIKRVCVGEIFVLC